MLRRFPLFLLLFLVLSISSLHGQSCQGMIVGKVVEVHSNSPLISASIRLLGTSQGKATNNDGQFKFDNLCSGQYQVQVQYIGYETITQQIVLGENESLDMTLQLEEIDHYLQHVVVKGAAASKLSTIPIDQLSEKEIAQNSANGLGSLLSSIRGVSTLKTGPGISKPIIQGLHSNRVMILNNGIRQEGQQWGSEHAPEIDPFVASKISVIKGAASVRYGSDAIGGLIIVEPADLHRTKSLGGEINVVGMTNSRMMLTSGLLEGGFGKDKYWGWRVQGTVKKAGDSNTPDYVLTNTGVQEVNLSAGLGFTDDTKNLEFFYSHFETDLGILRSAHTGSRTDFLEAILRPQPLIIAPFSYDIDNPRQHVTHDLYKLNAYLILPKNHKLSLVYGGQRNNRLEYDRRRGSLFDIPALDLSLTTHTLDLILEGVGKNNWQSSMGLNGLAQTNRWDPNTGKNPLIPWYNQQNIGAFYIQRYIKSSWEAEFGARYDFKSMLIKTFNRQNELLEKQLDFNNFSFNAGIQSNISDYFSISSHIGTAWRPPHVSELLSNGVHHGTASYEVGLLIDDNEEVAFSEKEVTSEISAKWINSATYSKGRFSVGIDAYINRIDNFIYLAPEPNEFILTSRGDFPLLSYRQVDALLTGFDANFRLNISQKLKYEFKSSVVNAQNRSENSPIVWMPANQFENNIRYNLESIGKVEDLHLSLGSILVSKQNRVDDDQDFMVSPAGYFLMNAHIGADIPFAKNALTIALNVDNILNTSYRDYLNRFRYFADDLGRNFTLSLKYNFHNHN
jgi:iron complex outermembrane receptor protein